MALKSTGKFPRRDLAANRAYKMSEDRCECVFHAAYATRNRAIVFQQNLDNRKNSLRAVAWLSIPRVCKSGARAETKNA